MSFLRRGNRNRSDKRKNEEEDDSIYIPNRPVEWRRFLTYLRPYGGRLALALLALIVSSALSLVFPAIIQQVVDTVLTQADLDLLNTITLILLVVFLVRSFTTFVQTYQLGFVGERVLLDIRHQIYRQLQRLSLGFFIERRVGELISRLASDVTVMQTLLTSSATNLISQSITLLGSVTIMFILNWRLTLFIVVLIPIVVAFGFVFGFYLRRISTQVQDALAGATTVAEEVLQNIREVKSFVREDYEIRRYEGALGETFAASIRLLRVRSVFGPIIAFFAFGALAMILWFGGREVIDGRLSGGELVAFLVYGLTVAGSFAAIINLYTEYQQAIGATKRVFEILDLIPQVQDAPGAQVLGQIDGRITFANVGFAYQADVPVLQDVTLDIAAGEIVALVGPSGAGKSTLLNLIPRFYDVSQRQHLGRYGRCASDHPVSACANMSASYRRRRCCSVAASVTISCMAGSMPATRR